MGDINLKGLGAIKADQELLDKTRARVLNISRRSRLNMRRIVAVACIAVLLGASALYYSVETRNRQAQIDNEKPQLVNNAVIIPAVKLPQNTNGIELDMIGLIVYQGKIFTQSATHINPDRAKDLMGEKLGTTIDGIDEWSKLDDYKEFASTIGRQDFYSVKGYSTDFRIMTYQQFEGVVYAEFFECLNGIAVYSGKDIVGKLNISGNIIEARYQKHSDWYYSTGVFSSLDNIELLNSVFNSLNDAAPSLLDNSMTVDKYWSNEHYRRLIMTLTDGSEVSLVVLSTGHVIYGYSWVAFDVESQLFVELWQHIGSQ